MIIATWNLDRVRPGLGARSQRIRRAILSMQADVWVLTETHSGCHFSDEFEAVASSCDAIDLPGSGEQWVSIWVRRSLCAEKEGVVGEPDRSAAVFIPIERSSGLLVFGTVLPWRSDAATMDRGANKFEKSLKAQVTDWRKLARTRRTASVCIAGDFNQELSAAGPAGSRRGLEALEKAFAENALTCVTSGDRDPLKRSRVNVDHIVLSKHLATGAAEPGYWPQSFPLPKGYSDHYCVRVDISDASLAAS
jgi:endonuclease/exonuclease/phosphatase family metal-dependent hydrolase